MISIQQWRVAIGCFNPGRRKSWSPGVIVLGGQPIRTGLRLLLAISVCIILCGDVETNPGPSITDVLKELREFRASSDLHFETLKGEIGSLRADIVSIRHDLDTVTEKVKQTIHDLDKIYDDNYADISSLKSQIGKLENHIETQERYSRRENLIFYDIPEEKDEKHETTTEKLINVLNDNVPSKHWTKDEFIRIHRLKTRQAGSAPIIARFLRPNDKFCVLNSRQRLKESGFGVSNDLTPAQREQLNRLKQEGKRGYFKNGKLIIDSTYSAGNHTSKSRPGNNADYNIKTRSQLGESSGGFPRGQPCRRNAQNEAGGGGNSNAQRETNPSRTNDNI